mgnify:CR=1 FL=1
MSRLQTPIRRNDTVVVTTGKDNGKRGRVLKVLPVKNRLIVEGVNIIKTRSKPKRRGMVRGRTTSGKKAIVQLSEGDKIEFFETM